MNEFHFIRLWLDCRQKYFVVTVDIEHGSIFAADFSLIAAAEFIVIGVYVVTSNGEVIIDVCVDFVVFLVYLDVTLFFLVYLYIQIVIILLWNCSSGIVYFD